MTLYHLCLRRLFRFLYRVNYWQVFALVGLIPWVVGLPLLAGIALGLQAGTPYTDFVGASSYASGWYQSCTELSGLPEPTCYDRAYAIQPPEWITDFPILGRWLVQ